VAGSSEAIFVLIRELRKLFFGDAVLIVAAQWFDCRGATIKLFP
jgi:hypothetical protein